MNKKYDEYWYIHGNVYDLSSFNHPGGPVALSQGKGRDCTGLFETYHMLTDKPKEVLKKYRVDVALPEEIKKSIFTNVFTEWNTDFTKELKEEARKILKDNSKMNWMRLFEILFIVLFTIPVGYCFFNGHYWTVPIFPFLCWVIMVNVFHDATHFAVSYNWVVNYISSWTWPYFASPFSWSHHHNLGHHVYTNMYDLDPDLHHGSYFYRYVEKEKYYGWFSLQMLYVWIIYGLSINKVALVSDFILMYNKVCHKLPVMKIEWSELFVLIFLRICTIYVIYIYPFIHYTIVKAVIFAVVPYFIFSTIFMLITQVNHITQKNLNIQSNDFFKHQILTSVDFCVDSHFWEVVTGGLNLQVGHHLFPGVYSGQLKKLQPVIKKLCEKHGIEYCSYSTFGEVLADHLDQLKICSKSKI